MSPVSAPPAPPAAVTSPRSVKFEVADVAIPQSEPKRLYECGTLDTCPVSNIAVAGLVTFARRRGTQPIDAEGRIHGPTQRGLRVRLTDKEVDRVKAAIKRKVVRPDGADRGVYTLDDKSFIPRVGDEPLAKHLFMTEIPESVAATEEVPPPAMA